MLGTARTYVAAVAIALGGLAHAQGELAPLPSVLRSVNDEADKLLDVIKKNPPPGTKKEPKS